MNGVHATHVFPATIILKLTGAQLARPISTSRADEVILAAVTHPPRIGETRPIAALMPQVLARYGLAERNDAEKIPEAPMIDLLG